MNGLTDQQLLRDYAGRRSETAFAELVRRHVDFVYSAAFRMVRDAHLAEDVTQGVFVALAQNAARLTDRPVLSGWLHRTAQNLAANVVRSEVRRRAREEEAAAMNELDAAEPDTVWEQIAPHLDAALVELSEADRDALLLRYFERKSAREMAQTLGTSEDAAQKRVSRAVERLREGLANRGVGVGASGLVVAVAANAVQTAPVGLSATITTATALVGAAIQTAATMTAAKVAAMTTIQKVLITATLTAAIGTALYQAHRASTARADLRNIQQEHQGTLAEADQLRTENQQLAARLRAQTGEIDALRKGQTELLQLRGQVGVLRQQLADLSGKLAQRDGRTNELASAWALGSVKWLAQWKDAGLGSPESALETYWWAVASGNVEKLQQCLVFDRGVTGEPVSQLYAQREARSESYPLRSGRIGGIRLFSFSRSTDANIWPPVERAKGEVEMICRVREEDGFPPNPDGSPSFKAGEKRILELIQVGDEWKVLGHENRVKLSIDDEDFEAVAKMMMQMDPKTLEQLKSDPRLPPRTLQAYEELKAKAAK